MESLATVGLNETLWSRVEKILADRGETFMDLYRTLPDAERPHDNTWYSWRARRTIMKINDLEALARALHVPAALLLTPIDEKGPVQLELSFEAGRSSVRLEIECSHKAIKLRGLQE